ncbi:unnamed protein product [Protopolystoma xenopodis]|uniref:Uncharacterized protein n=1 Tax=Protopolystoma xenopodis TaxID=117903 RepID=A0A448WU44_9PLAT|nr:unnamed protein product [Protopolystoma xenopodis]
MWLLALMMSVTEAQTEGRRAIDPLLILTNPPFALTGQRSCESVDESLTLLSTPPSIQFSPLGSHTYPPPRMHTESSNVHCSTRRQADVNATLEPEAALAVTAM